MARLEELKAQNPIVAVVERYGVSLQPSGKNYKALCPFHEEHTPSLHIYPEDGGFKCFGAGCGLHGDVIDFVGYQLHGLQWDKTNPPMFQAALEALGVGAVSVTGDESLFPNVALVDLTNGDWLVAETEARIIGWLMKQDGK